MDDAKYITLKSKDGDLFLGGSVIGDCGNPPVDPGSLGAGATTLPLFASRHQTFAGRVVMPLEYTDNSAGQTFVDAGYTGVGGTHEIVVRLDGVNGSNLNMGYSPAYFFPAGQGTGSYSYPIFATYDVTTGSQILMYGNDPRFVDGQYLKGMLGGSSFRIDDFNFQYNLGTTQADIDAYLAAKINYDNCMDGGTAFELVTNATGIAEKIKQSLLLQQGSCLYDLQAGFAWDKLHGTSNPITYDTRIRKFINNNPFIKNIESLSIQFNNVKRIVNIDVVVLTTLGISIPITFNTVI